MVGDHMRIAWCCMFFFLTKNRSFIFALLVYHRMRCIRYQEGLSMCIVREGYRSSQNMNSTVDRTHPMLVSTFYPPPCFSGNSVTLMLLSLQASSCSIHYCTAL
ncbi:hypothetical protein M011DRAFT_13725 [Sporormia fimetaria CBS 119925]|uniref:Uncharacterized protein n=1 Tax=Sporormia fimetaria CBS 119925 TaxID=1340428 RepID=A0A6A6VQD2_9PLEO|nr:hypothetical protein M011DRAFT_13725 [Sporormia fimetaria CBS 119925]